MSPARTRWTTSCRCRPCGHVRVQQAFLGTCTNGRLEDLAGGRRYRARQIGRGGHAVPCDSRFVCRLADAMRLGYIQTLMEAGAVIGVPGCGPCMGNHMGVPAPGEVTISSANRNFRGRMGTRDSDSLSGQPRGGRGVGNRRPHRRAEGAE